MGHEKMAQKSCCFLRFCNDFGGPGPPGGFREKSCKKYPKRSHLGTWVTSVLGPYFRAYWLPNRICVHLFGVYFYACFWHRFWEASGTNLEGSCIILGFIFVSFCHFVGDAAKLQKCNTSKAKTLFLVVPGRPFHSIFANFLKFLFVLQSR